ncbi:MAG TPA: hypothetical protein PK029_01755 [Bacteroidales bacterium]|nr:MAG: hypothetical protein BWY22_00579 [Bacteroidetes bacterium ADurb.Bin217]HPH15867.1 hypothetical protein [Bacteroidales bacterium]
MQYSKKKSPELVEQSQTKTKQAQAQPQQTTYSTTAKSFKDLKKDVLQTPVQAKQEVPPQKSDAPEVIETTVIQDISQDSILKAWSMCVQSLQNDAQLSAIVKQLQPEISGTDIRFIVHSSLEKSTFEQNIRAHYIQCIKQTCGTTAVAIHIDIVEETYTPKPSNNADKYEYLVKQNPFLQTMKDTFNLEIE